MGNTCDILIFGTGSFAQRIACDLAATAAAPTRLTIAGRNGLRLDWISTAARAPAPARQGLNGDAGPRPHLRPHPGNLPAGGTTLAPPNPAGGLPPPCPPAVVLQPAPFQWGSVFPAWATAWPPLVAEGGLSPTA